MTTATGTDKLAESAAHAIDAAASGASAVANSGTVKSLDAALATMIDASVRNAGDAISWTKEQIPDVIQQLLMWRAISSAIWFVAGVLLFVLAIAAVRHNLKVLGLQARDINESKKEHARLRDEWIGETDASRSEAAWQAYYAHTQKYGDPDYIGGNIVAAVSVLAGSSLVSCNTDWLQIWIAPKVYLIEYAASLVKG
jgi:hypothetical protein